jgi:hypothetical protein
LLLINSGGLRSPPDCGWRAPRAVATQPMRGDFTKAVTAHGVRARIEATSHRRVGSSRVESAVLLLLAAVLLAPYFALPA